MLTERKYQLSDYFGHQKQSYVSYERPEHKLRKEYVLEYCDDEDKLNRVGLRPEFGGLEIDDAYHSKTYKESETETDTFDGIAISMFLAFLFRKDICDVKLWENLYLDGEMIQERWFDFPCTFMGELKRIINKDIEDIHKTSDALAKELDVYMAFVN